MAGLNNDNQKHTLEEVLQQFVNLQLRGQRPDIDEFARKYPEFEDQIRRRIRKLQKINNMFDTLVQPDERDFEDTVAEQNLVGKKIGSFEIVEVIGRGGMGVVYLARDTKLDRNVAVKSIPAELQASSTAQARFQREAKLLASLNHPNIAVIHEIIEQEEGASYLVLEYVPGQTLAQRIAHKPLKFEEVLSIAQQVAEAVSAAHDKGVIHRDLKPGNIKITPDGRVKVLDFGLAKALGGESSEKPTTVTQPGRVMGTPAYMSPEQACGKSTDRRTDIWSFGCLMYEMLTGHLPFEGETATEILARIIERQPDWEMLPQDTPSNIRVLLRRCLEKDPRQRLQDIGDAAIEINETLCKPATTPTATLRRMAMIIGAVAIGIILFGIALKYIPQKEIQLSSKEIRLVVLPFENLGPAADSYFATGLTDEVTTRLAGVHGLRVYKNRDGVATQIIKELGVDYILEGTIQRARRSDPNSPVRIRPQLIRVSDDSLVWAKPYDDDKREVLQIQSDLAEEIAQALDITLLEPERRAIASRPTENKEAYKYYLRGNEYFLRSILENDFKIALGMYEKAIELDSTFALAHAQLSRTHMMMYWHIFDRSEKRLALAEQAVNRALQLNPNLPEAHLALGHYYYHGHLDYDRALEQFAIARKSQPNNSEFLSEVLEFVGFVQRRQGKFEEALGNIKRAFELDPLASRLAYQIALTFKLLRKYPKAEDYYDRAIRLRPDWPTPYARKANLYLLWEGKTEKARAVLQEALENIKSTENFEIIDWLVDIDVFDGNYQEALDRLSLKSKDIDNQYYFIPKALRYARIYRYMGDNQKSKEYYEQAIDILKSKIAEDPNDARFHSSLGIAYVGLGRREDALREGKLAVELLPVTKEAMRGLWRVEELARIYVMVGKYDKAIDQLEDLLSRPGWMSIHLLQLDPVWDPLRNHPHFKKLIGSAK
ncbi:MAG: protein kinase domain-containing protein [Planctomycetota bacterium]|jgi:serine/threonine-protein kinase